jgi:Stf0 sulphotransferase
MFSDKSGRNEIDYFRLLYSEQWDRADAAPVRLRYAILAEERTGSELLSAHLRQRGVGIPLEYFHDRHLPALAARFGCVGADGQVDVARYRAELERRRSSRNGIFGAKIVMPQLARLAGNDAALAAQFIGSFDKVVLMRRRNTLLQAISLMRAMATAQWHVIPGDPLKPVDSPDESRLFARITYCWARVLDQSRDLSAIGETLSPAKARWVWYEDLAGGRAGAEIAEWLCEGTGAAPGPAEAGHALPQKGDSGEAESIMQRYLAYLAIVST